MHQPSSTQAPRPLWLVAMEPEPGGHSALWAAILDHVELTANESGFFGWDHDSWLVPSGLSWEDSRVAAEWFEAAGGLERIAGRLYVVGWRTLYRREP